jgi:inner membrane protein involved in colicin E2 resistance
MFYIALKFIITAGVVVGVSEIAKRSSYFAAMLAALPLTSILAMVWIYVDTKDSEKIVDLSYGIFWLVLPTLLFFILLPALLKNHMGFWPSMIISIAVMVVFYLLFAFFGKRLGLPL